MSGKLAEAASTFAALGDETRLRIVMRLCKHGPLSIANITAGAGVSRQAVSKHLTALAEAGLLRGERAGREHVWRLQPRRIAEVRTELERISRQWDDALERLRAFVEDT